MPIVNGYCTLDELAAKMGLDAAKKTAHQTHLETSIEDASRYIDEQTDSIFFVESITDEIVDFGNVSEAGFYIGSDCTEIVAKAPIISITGLTESGLALTEKTSFSGTGDYYLKKKSGLIVKNEGRWSTAALAIQFSGSLGFAVAPKDIREICLTLATLFSRMDNRIVTDGEGNSINILSSSIPLWVKRGLKKRKRAIV